MTRRKKGARQAGAQTDPQAPAETEQKHSERQAATKPTAVDEPADFPIVGIGASAGGLAAFEAFLSGMPSDTNTGIAFVFVQHLAPNHVSILGELIKRYTSMQVHEVTDGMRVEPDNVYVIPPNHEMALLNGALHLLQPVTVHGLRLPIDQFFRSLAQDQRSRAIGIILSGTGTDGTLGARSIKGEGGMVMAQSPESTEHDGMPASVIASGIVDYVLPPADMPAQLFAYVNNLFGKPLQQLVERLQRVSNTLKKIAIVVRTHTGHDFSQYKENTVLRRVRRRMALQEIESLESYLRFLQSSPAESRALFRDLLIGVTSFFRDPDAFAALKEKVLPRIFTTDNQDRTVRVWVTGCSTGEEAYSIAILIREYLNAADLSHKVQIFATDIDGDAISQARLGVFPVSIAADVSDERLSRNFVLEPDNTHYRVKKSIRDMLVFSEQDLIRDPPFSRVDLISCRNVMIYMSAELQRTLIPLFHYSLNPEGILFLGTSESAGEHSSLFTALDRKWKLYIRRQDLARAPTFMLPGMGSVVSQPPGSREMTKTRNLKEGPLDLRRLTEQALLEHYAQVGVLVDNRGEIRFIHGRTGKFLEPPAGDASVNILSMARDGLRRELTTALHKATTQNETIRNSGLRIRTNGDTISARLVVQPIPLSDNPIDPKLYLVILEEISADHPRSQEPTPPSSDQGESQDVDSRIAALEHELGAKEEYLQSTLEEMETANEELRSTNEELQSVNEELQSTNEELETSKEELQSVNEELATVNAELQAKVTELSRANNDMNNLLAGTAIGTLFVDHHLRITRFTPAITQVLNLIQSDVGRPIDHIVTNLVDYNDLVNDIKTVLDNLMQREAEVKTKSGAWYIMRVRPYRTLDNVIEGAVVTFVDITERRRAEATAWAQLAEISSYYDNIPIALAVLDTELRFVRINKRMAEINGLPPGDHIGKSIDTIRPELARQAQKIAEQARATGKAVVDLRLSGRTGAERSDDPSAKHTWQTGWYPLTDEHDELVGYSVIVYELDMPNQQT